MLFLYFIHRMRGYATYKARKHCLKVSAGPSTQILLCALRYWTSSDGLIGWKANTGVTIATSMQWAFSRRLVARVQDANQEKGDFFTSNSYLAGVPHINNKIELDVSPIKLEVLLKELMVLTGAR